MAYYTSGPLVAEKTVGKDWGSYDYLYQYGRPDCHLDFTQYTVGVDNNVGQTGGPIGGAILATAGPVRACGGSLQAPGGIGWGLYGDAPGNDANPNKTWIIQFKQVGPSINGALGLLFANTRSVPAGYAFLSSWSDALQKFIFGFLLGGSFEPSLPAVTWDRGAVVTMAIATAGTGLFVYLNGEIVLAYTMAAPYIVDALGIYDFFFNGDTGAFPLHGEIYQYMYWDNFLSPIAVERLSNEMQQNRALLSLV